MNRNDRRRVSSRAWLGLMYLLTVLALIPLALVLWFTIAKGLPSVIHPQFFFNAELPPCEPKCPAVSGAGVGHAIVGTGVMVGLASLMAIPIGVLCGIYLAEYSIARWSAWVRLACDVLVGTPSIAIGLFVYAFLVVPFHHFSGYSGAVALAILMLPIIARTTEGAVSLIPNGLRESGLALGLPRWRVSLQLILPAAAPGVITGALLAVARAGGETAPLLFTAFGAHLLVLNPNQAMQALPVTVFRYALLPYKSLQAQAWGAALVLIVLVLAINLISRWVLRRQIALAGQL
ncbi:MAG TPA: phosphate ABC transporter permease PstA [Candidatus Limnocylindrales bacterium]|nr:phosphate ABC transporter permease PstA [Candidatus Limnocylindrales bacterium]